MKRIPKAVRLQKIAEKLASPNKYYKPETRADGSMRTKPTVLGNPNAIEAQVMAEVEAWLGRNGCTMDRLNNGAGYINNSHNYCTYGILGGGDWVGMLPNGRHLEVECKKGSGGVLSRNQVARMNRVHRGNGVYVVVHGAEELAEKLKIYLDK